jgi:hypothetical protein
LPAFLTFLKAYKADHPDFDEKGTMACYRLRTEKQALLAPSYEQDMMTLDPVRPKTKRENKMKACDDFCSAYNDFAIQYGRKCPFNQTKNLSKTQVEGLLLKSGKT